MSKGDDLLTLRNVDPGSVVVEKVSDKAVIDSDLAVIHVVSGSADSHSRACVNERLELTELKPSGQSTERSSCQSLEIATSMPQSRLRSGDPELELERCLSGLAVSVLENSNIFLCHEVKEVAKRLWSESVG